MAVVYRIYYECDYKDCKASEVSNEHWLAPSKVFLYRNTPEDWTEVVRNGTYNLYCPKHKPRGA